jgi:hypothetical protein
MGFSRTKGGWISRERLMRLHKMLEANPSFAQGRGSLRFVRSNERANIVRHIQQLQPLFFVQVTGNRPMP